MFTLGSQEYNCIRGFVFVPLVLLGLGENIYLLSAVSDKKRSLSVFCTVFIKVFEPSRRRASLVWPIQHLYPRNTPSCASGMTTFKRLIVWCFQYLPGRAPRGESRRRTGVRCSSPAPIKAHRRNLGYKDEGAQSSSSESLTWAGRGGL